MEDNNLKQLGTLGQSIWLDYIHLFIMQILINHQKVLLI